MAHSERILVVDDDELVLRALTRILERAGHHVMARASLREAREVMASSEVDTVVTDYQLPDGTGAELVGEFQRSRPCARVVMLSGDKPAQLPGVITLEKPVRATELLAVLDQLRLAS